jgi:hypothetical protein
MDQKIDSFLNGKIVDVESFSDTETNKPIKIYFYCWKTKKLVIVILIEKLANYWSNKIIGLISEGTNLDIKGLIVNMNGEPQIFATKITIVKNKDSG